MTLPPDFIRLLHESFENDVANDIQQGLSQQPTVSIRIHPEKSRHLVIDTDYIDGGVPWCPHGVYLNRRIPFTFDPLMHGGVYYVQDASSMIIHHIIKQYIKSSSTVLDLCAAPGGKTITALTALPEGSTIIANEPIAARNAALVENLQKNGFGRAIITRNYPKQIGETSLAFDLIIADVPCSGEGMFRKEAEAVSQWSTEQVHQYKTLQRQIITDIWPRLKPGGIMIYSTCTINREENEDNIYYFIKMLGAEALPIKVEDSWQIRSLSGSEMPTYRFLPGQTKGEGLFVVVLKKPIFKEEHSPKKYVESKQKNKKITQDPMLNGVLNWIHSPEDYQPKALNDEVYVIPKDMNAIYETINKSLKITHAGTKAAGIKGKTLIPHTALALSSVLNHKAFAKISLDQTQSIAYLQKQAIGLQTDVPKDYVIVSFAGVPLGFAKNLGNRANNLYPNEWRIKSTHLPDKVESLFKVNPKYDNQL